MYASETIASYYNVSLQELKCCVEKAYHIFWHTSIYTAIQTQIVPVDSLKLNLGTRHFGAPGSRGIRSELELVEERSCEVSVSVKS